MVIFSTHISCDEIFLYSQLGQYFLSYFTTYMCDRHLMSQISSAGPLVKGPQPSYSFPDISLSNWFECPLTTFGIRERIAIITSPLSKGDGIGLSTALKANEIMFYC